MWYIYRRLTYGITITDIQEAEMAKYCIGIDYKAFMGLALLINAETGEEVSGAKRFFTRKVTDDGFMNPMDYLDVLSETIPALLRDSQADPADIIGIGINFNESAVLPVMSDGTPLCFFKEYSDNPYASVMLSDYKRIQTKTETINRIAAKRSEAFLSRFAGRIQNDGLISKAMELVENAPGVYDICDYLIEASDWVVWQLTGVLKRNSYNASLHAFWSSREGYPSSEFFASLDRRLAGLVKKLGGPVEMAGACAGKLSAFAAKSLGLSEDTAVSVAGSAMQSLSAAVGIDAPGKMLALFDESCLNMLVTDTDPGYVPEILASSSDLFPGSYAYFANHEDSLSLSAFPGGCDLFAGKNGLLAIDIDSRFVYLGAKADTTKEELSLAALEAKIYGFRGIIEKYRAHGANPDELYIIGDAAGNEALMQLYSDILNLPVHACLPSEYHAKGSAVYAACAAGKYDSIFAAAHAMSGRNAKIYLPATADSEIYDKLYYEYIRLSDYFKGGANDVMKRLENISDDNKNVPANDEPEYDEALPTLESEFGITGDEKLPEKEEYSDEVKAAAAAAAKELFEAIDAVAAIRDNAEIYAAFNDLINEEAEKNTKEILASTDEVVRLMEDAEHNAVFGDAIEEEAEKNTREIIAAIDEVVRLMEEADREAAEKNANDAQ